MSLLQEARTNVWYDKLKVYGLGQQETRLFAEVVALVDARKSGEIDVDGLKRLVQLTGSEEFQVALKDFQYNQNRIMNNG